MSFLGEAFFRTFFRYELIPVSCPRTFFILSEDLMMKHTKSK